MPVNEQWHGGRIYATARRESLCTGRKTGDSLMKAIFPSRAHLQVDPGAQELWAESKQLIRQSIPGGLLSIDPAPGPESRLMQGLLPGPCRL